MRSKFSARLYRRLALAASKEKWVPGRENVVEVYATTDELAHWIGWPRQKDGSVHSGKLRDRFLKRIDDDFASVRAFALECEEDRASTRGRPLLGITFRLRLQPPSRHTVRVPAVVQRGEFRPGFKDEPRYCVEDRTWRAAAKKFREQLPTSPKGLSDLWKVALQEALDGIQHTDGYANRQFRGERLLAAIDARGADYAAWSFLAEEAESPDLWSMPLQERAKAEYSADEARKERIGWKKPRSSEITAPAAHPETETANPDFETCTHIVLTANPALNSIEVGRLGDKIKSMKPDFTGGRVITLTIRFQVGTAYDRWNVGYFSLSEDDLDVILTKFRGEFDPNSVAEFEIMCDEDMRRPDGNVEIHLLHGRVRRRGYQLDHESRLIEEYRSRPAPAEDVRPSLRFMLEPEAMEEASRLIKHLRQVRLTRRSTEARMKWCKEYFAEALLRRFPLVEKADKAVDGAISEYMRWAAWTCGFGTYDIWHYRLTGLGRRAPKFRRVIMPISH